MCIVETYKQTFHNQSPSSEASFSFTRIYKSNPEQTLRLTVESIGWQTTMDTDLFSPPIFYLEGCNALVSGKCLTQNGTNEITNNGWYLGGNSYNDVGNKKSHMEFTQPNSMSIYDLPLSTFKIVMRHLDGSTHPSTFAVSFSIDVIEE
jgi:hypothetical protein